MTKAIVLLSGGQDSCTCLYWAKKQFDQVEAIGFFYGQKHEQELIQAAKIATTAGIDYRTFPVKGLLGGSSLTDHEKDHNSEHDQNSSLPASFTAGRNMLFLTIAGSYAFGKGVRDIVTGVCQTDFSGYPDCRRTFIDSVEETLDRAMGIDEGDGFIENRFKIHTPLMLINKAETFKLAKELGCLDVIINDTMTDYNGDMTMNEWGRGVDNNPATHLRVKGFYEAKEKGWI